MKYPAIAENTANNFKKNNKKLLSHCNAVNTLSCVNADALTPMPHRLAQCMSPQGWAKLVNAELLSLINEACVNYAALPSSRVNSSAPLVCRHDRVIREAVPVGLVQWEGIGGGWDIE